MGVNGITVVLGLLAWLIPMRAVQPKRIERGYVFLLLSLGACAMSMQLQLFVVLTLMWSGQTTGLEDRIDTLLLWCAVLVVGTFLLNAWAVHRKKLWKHQVEIKALEAELRCVTEKKSNKTQNKTKKKR